MYKIFLNYFNKDEEESQVGYNLSKELFGSNSFQAVNK